MLLSFRESDAVPAPAEIESSQERVVELEEQLRHVQYSRQMFVEELEAANEELRSTNEELQSTNEELQSANEELETSREEMQLLNEELRTVNDELGAKIADIERAHDDLSNLVNATGTATISLDSELRIMSFTPRAQELMKLIPGDVGRPIDDLASYFSPPVTKCAHEVLATLVQREEEVRHVGGQWFQMQIHPYRTADNVIDGLVVSFRDVTEARTLRRRLDQASVALEAAHAGLAAWNGAGVHQWTLGVPLGIGGPRDPFESQIAPDLLDRVREMCVATAEDGEQRTGTVGTDHAAEVHVVSVMQCSPAGDESPTVTLFSHHPTQRLQGET